MSRLRSAPAASRGSGPAARPPGRQVMVPTAKSDIYVALLGIALGAILLGCLMLVLVLNRYGFQTKVSANLSAPSTATALASLEKNPTIPDTVRL